MKLWAVALVALTLLACGDKVTTKKPGDDELTIVVQADRSRLEGEQAALNDQRKSLEQDRDALRKQLERLGEGTAVPQEEVADLKKKILALMEQQSQLSQKSEAMVKQSDDLVRRVITGGSKGALAAPPAAAPAAVPAPVAAAPAAATAEIARVTGEVAVREKEMAGRERTLAEREKELADREKALAGREALVAQRETASGRATPRDHGLSASRPAVERAFKTLQAALEAKGVLAADLPPAKQKLVQDAGTSRAAGDLAKAINAIEAAQAAVDQVTVDGDFISEKVKRVNAMTQKKAPDPKKRDQVAKLLQEVTRSYSDGRFAEANRALNNIVLLLEK